MPNYRRNRIQGGSYFFTVNLLSRQPQHSLIHNINLLRGAVIKVQKKWPFYIDAMVVLPDHIHAVWTLPEKADNTSLRWRLIKQYFSRGIAERLPLSASQSKRQERGIWQRRFWEHVITSEMDYIAHLEYCHLNPVKHGYVENVKDWPYSTFHRYVEKNVYKPDWVGRSHLTAVGE